MRTRIIGISGLAGSGKDTFFTLLKKQVPNIKRFALADALKSEIRPQLLEQFNIDILNCTREEKEKVRTYLVAFGKEKRDKSSGTHWTSLITPSINDYLSLDDSNVACVTDIRYDIYPEDEVFWIKNKMNGKLVHISLFEYQNGKHIFLQAPNKDEEENNPKLQSKANFKVFWPKLISPENKNPDWEKLSIYATECLSYFER